jgi:outer membrane lipoprotein SlyB
MSDNDPTPSIGFREAPLRANPSFSRPAALVGGAVALVAATALATTLVLRPQPLAQADAGAAQAARTLALAPGETVVASPAPGAAVVDGDDVPATRPAPVAAPEPAAAKPAPVARTAAPAPAAKRSVAKAVCATCGVVETVTAVRRKGEGSGVGAVGGAVVGGLLGNQMGDGNGRKAMTVLGAVGGGLAGNEIEKRQKATTLYRVTVRMNDGSARTVTQASAPVVGAKVTLDGSTLRARG